MKRLGHEYKDLWDRMCEENVPQNVYNKTKNTEMYDDLNINKHPSTIEHFLQHSDNAVHYLRKPLPNKSTIQPDLTVHTSRITDIPNIFEINCLILSI